VMTLALVGCGSEKREQRYKKIKAKDRYTSDYFTLKKNFARKIADEWCILSAKHGVVEPDEKIEYYDVAITNYHNQQMKRWTDDVVSSIRGRQTESLVFLAGRDYTDPLENHLSDYRIARPFAKTGGNIDQMLRLEDAITNMYAAESSSAITW